MRSGGFPSSKRMQGVLEADASAQLVTEINQLLSFDALYTWQTMEEEGLVVDWQHVRSMVDRVGSSFEMAFLTVVKTGNPARFAQCCGDAATGMVVEVSSPSGADLVTRLHAKAWEGHLITNLRWAYSGADDELHTPQAAMEIYFERLVQSRAEKIGLIGDIHGELGHLLTVLRMFPNRGIDTILQLGDFGMVWPQGGWVRDLSKLDRTLARLDQTLYWLDGNHEDHRELTDWPVSPDGIRWIRDAICHLPRGFRTFLASGKTLAVLGGANSIDFAIRPDGIGCWAEESITEADLQRLGHETADIPLGHDAPLSVPSLDAQLDPSPWLENEIAYAAAGSAIFHRGSLQVKPALCVSGHYRCHVDETCKFQSSCEKFVTRIVVLDMNDSATKVRQEVLDVDTLELEFLTRKETAAKPRAPGETVRWQMSDHRSGPARAARQEEVIWICEENHIWVARIGELSSGPSCPSCARGHPQRGDPAD
jgi:predicted phosphodiesterase